MSQVVDWRVSLGLVGTVYRYLTVPLFLPILVAVYYRESPVPFIAAIVVAAIVGTLLEWQAPDDELGHREAFLLVSLTWLAVPLLGMIPYLVAGDGTVAQPANAFFESMSGFTTTGSTVLGSISFEVHSRSMLMWRQLTQWLGGMGIIVLMVAILPELSVGGARLIREEAPGFDLTKLRPKIRETARILWLIYIGLTVAAVAVYYGLHLLGAAPNMDFYNAVAHALTSLPTGGFSPEARSVEAFSPAVQWAVTLFMVVAGTNFALFWYVIIGQPEKLVDNREFRSYLLAMSIVTAVLTVLLFTGVGLSWTPTGVGIIPNNLEPSLRQAAFQTAAIVTTTGYASMDFNTWSEPAKAILLVAMFLGGSAGSAAGSIKIIRWYVVGKSLSRELFTTIHPEAVRPLRISESILIDEDDLRGLVLFVLVFLIIFALATIVVFIEGLTNPAIDYLSTLEAMSVAIATLGNIGPGFGIVGPMNSFLSFSPQAKLFMAALMWIGRLEILSVLVVLSPAYWRR